MPEMINMKSLGSRIAARRREQGLTQRQLALAMSVSPQAVSKWEHGAAFPDPVFLDELAETLDLTLDELLVGSDARERSLAG